VHAYLSTFQYLTTAPLFSTFTSSLLLSTYYYHYNYHYYYHYYYESVP